MTAVIINSFTGPFHFLSNFAYSDVVLDGVTYPTVEHAFQAAKAPPDRRQAWLETDNPGHAKRLGRRVRHLAFDWEERKEDVMLDLLRQKFARGTRFARLLKNTGDAELVEGNTWGDMYWGVCGSRGKNRLGVLLMQVREEIST